MALWVFFQKQLFPFLAERDRLKLEHQASHAQHKQGESERSHIAVIATLDSVTNSYITLTERDLREIHIVLTALDKDIQQALGELKRMVNLMQVYNSDMSLREERDNDLEQMLQTIINRLGAK